MKAGDPVIVEYRKWGDLPHWRYEMRRVGQDKRGVWLGGQAGTPARRGGEDPVSIEHPFVQLIAPTAWWSPIWNSEGEIAVYVDVVEPAVWEDGLVRMIDLDLDVIRRRDGSVAVLDEDEFTENSAAYPEYVVSTVRAAVARLVMALEADEEPFCDEGPGWLERFVEETRSDGLA